MNKSKFELSKIFLGVMAATLSASTIALPALQLGSTSQAGWTYNTTTETWVYTGGTNEPAKLAAYANATKALGGDGQYAWDTAGDPARWAYLVVAATPKLSGNGDPFDISVTGATFLTSGYGNPPVEDDNDLQPHSIFDTYFEIYKFQFDGLIGDIFDTKPPGGGTGKGYSEELQIEINSLIDSVTGLHFDLFTAKGDGIYTADGFSNRNLVAANAPYSHDAEWNPTDPTEPTEQTDPTDPTDPTHPTDPTDPTNPTFHDVPVPGTALLLGLGLGALGRSRRRLRK